jgi:mannose-6-phosphate isomerase-like protein (cupin superfamily)
VPRIVTARGAEIQVVLPEEGKLGPFRILATGEQTRGAYFALDSLSRGAPLAEPHLHVVESEAEYVATGERLILAGDRELRAPAGSFVLIPPRVAHDMTGTVGSRWLHLFAPAGIERWFVERQRMSEAGASREAIDAAAARYGVLEATRAAAPVHAVIADAPIERRVLASGDETGGAYAVTEYADVLWRAPLPPHTHEDADEGLYVAAGEIEIVAAGETVRAVPGTFVFIPRGVPHNVSTPPGESARFIAIRSPA